MTENEILKALRLPNGSELLAKQENAIDRIEDVIKIITETVSKSASEPSSEMLSVGPALSFLVRMSRKQVGREKIQAEMDPLLWDQLLCSSDPKVRKNSARLLGALGRKDREETLIRALSRETVDLVRPSQILALGAMKTERAAAFLAAYTIPETIGAEKHRREEEEALRKARALLIKPKEHPFVHLPKGYPLILTVGAGLEEVLAEEVNGLGGCVIRKQKGALTVELKKEKIPMIKEGEMPDILTECRCYREWLIPLQRKIPEKQESWLPVREEILSILKESLQEDPTEERYTFRIQAEEGKAKKSHEGGRTEKVSRIAKALEMPNFVNAPSHYEVELRIHKEDLWLKLMTAKDERFSYRKQAIAASIHPANAAGVVRLAAPFLKEQALVTDPCCGSATLLIERAMYKKRSVAKLMGSDISKIALEAAKENLNGMKQRVSFVLRRRDLTKPGAIEPVDELFVNLPFGNRVGDHQTNQKLYRALTKSLKDRLKPEGIAVLYTMEGKLLQEELNDCPELTIVKKARIEAGGLDPKIYFVKRR